MTTRHILLAALEPDNPAVQRIVVIFYGTGVGTAYPSFPGGHVRPFSPLYTTNLPTNASIGGVSAPVLFARLARRLPGGIPVEPGAFQPIRHKLLSRGGHYRHLAELGSYCDAQQRPGELYLNSHGWASKAILNIASSRRFSSDRTIREYARKTWKTTSCDVA